MTIREMIQPILGMGGWCSEEKAEAMAELIVTTGPSLCVEIGVFGGRSLAATAFALRRNGHGVVYGIDPWTNEACLEGKNDPENDRWWGTLDLAGVYADAIGSLAIWGLLRYTRIVAAPSQCVHGMFNPGTIDILHLDGNHSEQASCRDLSLYLPLVRPEGHIWCDDTDWPTMQKAVGILSGQRAYIKTVGNCKLFGSIRSCSVPNT